MKTGINCICTKVSGFTVVKLYGTVFIPHIVSKDSAHILSNQTHPQSLRVGCRRLSWTTGFV